MNSIKIYLIFYFFICRQYSSIFNDKIKTRCREQTKTPKTNKLLRKKYDWQRENFINHTRSPEQKSESSNECFVTYAPMVWIPYMNNSLTGLWRNDKPYLHTLYLKICSLKTFQAEVAVIDTNNYCMFAFLFF